MPWQLSGNGRSDWSTKLIRGLKAEAAAGFQSRRGRCCEPTPVTSQYATFSTYKAARVRRADCRAAAAWPFAATGVAVRHNMLIKRRCSLLKQPYHAPSLVQDDVLL